jgi:pimeloyl-ACP methyl ester carboxylesterase
VGDVRSVHRTLRRVLLALVALAVLLLLAGARCDRAPAALEARYAAPPSRFVDVDGARVHYRDRGSGEPPIVLIHGSNSSLFTWESWAETLATEHRVVTLDMPGHGLTGPDPRQRYSAAEMTEFLDHFATAVGLTRFVVGGNSMGGSVAWHFTVLHPSRVAALVLVDSAGLPREEPRPFAFRMMSTPVLGRIMRWETPRFLVAASTRDAYGEGSRVADALIDRYDDLILREGNREATRERFSRPDDTLHERLGEIHVPTLILWGEKDRWILPKYAGRFHERIAGSKLVMLEGLGHVPMEEDPATSVAAVKTFLASVSVASSGSPSH